MLRRQTAGSLLVLAIVSGLLGCSSGKEDEEFKAQKTGKEVKPAEVDHHHDYGPGPHQGRMVDLGTDHKHVTELTYSKEPRKITVYVLDHYDTNKPLPIAAESMTLEVHGEDGEHQPITLSAEPQEGDGEGKSSRFTVQGEAIPAFIQDLKDIEGHLKVQLGEETLEADYEEEHDHEDHNE